MEFWEETVLKKMLSFDLKGESAIWKRIMGIVLALAAVLFWRCLRADNIKLLIVTLLFAAAFIVIGFVRFTAHTPRTAVFLNLLWGIGYIALITALCAPFNLYPGGLYRILLNLLCAFIVVAFFLGITAKWKTAVIVSTFALSFLMCVNIAVYAFRGRELGISDFLSVKTALSVVGQYSFLPPARFLLLFYGFFFGFFSSFSIPAFPRIRISKLCVRGSSLLAVVIMVLLLNLGMADIPIETFDFKGTDVNGYFLNFSLGIKDMLIDKPEAYSVDTINAYAAHYSQDAEKSTEETPPNIIVIMDETFSDLRIYSRSFSTNQSVTPYIDSLSENVIRGYALCSVFGGNTANTEFEFLTGHTMGFLPINTVPYQQYIFDDVFSLAWVLKSYGYATFATHPFLAGGWSRPSVYPRLGFEEFTFEEDYPRKDLIRSYVSDNEMFEYILKRLEEKESEKPLFLMGITMQNHGGYDYVGENYTQTIQLEGFQREYSDVEQYLSLIHETDRAVEQLLEKLQKSPEKTIVLFFGDHQPMLQNEFYEELNGGSLETLEQKMIQHTVPFFIWANYDLPSDNIPCTSINYLPVYLLEYAGLETPAYFNALKDIMQTIPVINAYGYYSLEKGCFLPLEEATGKEAEMLAQYEMLQYNDLFDIENRNEILFEKYIVP